jgi:hypothetical protein
MQSVCVNSSFFRQINYTYINIHALYYKSLSLKQTAVHYFEAFAQIYENS